jgi:hypothetical protein
MKDPLTHDPNADALLSKRRGGFLRDRVRAIHSNESQTIEHVA